MHFGKESDPVSSSRDYDEGGLKIIHDRFVGDDPERIASLDRAAAEADIAQSLFDLRAEAGLSQDELAARVGTTASVIGRIEEADYDGHSMAMLRRVAAALGRRVEIRFPVMGESNETISGP